MFFRRNVLAFLSVIVAVFLMMPFFVFAQDGETTVELTADEVVTAEDLGVGDPSILPGSFLYPFKDMWRGVRTALTFDNVKKAELKLDHANERLLEAQKLVEEGDDGKKADRLNQAMEKYEADLAKIQEITANIKEKIADNPKLDAFVDKLADSEIKRYKVMQRIQERAPEQALTKIMEAKEEGAKNFGQIIKKVMEEKNIVKKIEGILEKQEGSELKNLKQMQVIREIKESLPEDIQEKFNEVEVNLRQKFEKQVKNIDAQKVKNYLDNMQGDETKELEIMSQLKNLNMISIELKQKIQASENQVRTQLQNRIENIENSEVREKVIEKIDEDFQKYNPNLLKSLNQIHERKINTAPLEIKKQEGKTVEESIQSKPEEEKSSFWSKLKGNQQEVKERAQQNNQGVERVDFEKKQEEKKSVWETEQTKEKMPSRIDQLK